MKEFNKLLISFRGVKTKKPEIQLKNERTMKNVEELYRKYYNAYKSDYDCVDELNEAENKRFDYKQFELVNKTNK